jgi:hypothetical protein
MDVRLRPDVFVTDTDNGLVLLDGRSGRYWEVNGTGAVTLRGLLDGDSADQVAKALTARYDVPLDQAAADVTSFISSLRDAGLVWA